MLSSKPKCLIEILGKPMLEYLLDSIKKSSVDEVIIVVGNNKEEFIKLYPNYSFAIQEEINGTALALLAACPYLSKDSIAIVLPGDSPLINTKTIDMVLSEHQLINKEVTIVTTKVTNPFGYGRVVRKKGRIKAIIEEKNTNAKTKMITEVNTGIMCFNNRNLANYLNEIKRDPVTSEYYLTDILQIIPSEEINDISVDNESSLLGANTLSDLARLESQVSQRIIEEHMLHGVRFINPYSSTVYPSVIISQGSVIMPNTILIGNTVIMNEATIGPNTVIRDSTIANNTVITSSYITKSIIGKNNSIGPFSNIRENCIIGDNNRIGNYVEMKNAQLGDNTKVSHHSYLGDTICGNKVNFGCGCITANYNGKIKQQTVIEDGAFIGCNSNLVAPLRIGKNSYIAAGSTVTHDVFENTLVIARAKEIFKNNCLFDDKNENNC